MPRALVIGAGGQDGRLLSRHLLDRDYDVRGWVRAEGSNPPPCPCGVVDLLQSAVVEQEIQALQPDEIYYLAAFHHSTEDTFGEDAAELLRRSFDVHVTGLINVLRGLKKWSPKARLFYAASSHIFGRSETEWQDEQSALRPDSAYGISKAAGIQCCRFYRQQEGLFAATGILFNHESALRKPSFLSRKIVQGALQAEQDPTWRFRLGDLDASVDWGYAPDYVDAIWRILQLPGASDFVVATGELHTVREFAQAAFGALGLDWNRHVLTDAGLLNRRSYPLRGNPQKLKQATGWSPTMGFAQMVAKLVQETKSLTEAR